MHEPELRTLQILLNGCPGDKTVPSGTVTSTTNAELFTQAAGAAVGARVGAGVATVVGAGDVAGGVGAAAGEMGRTATDTAAGALSTFAALKARTPIV